MDNAGKGPHGAGQHEYHFKVGKNTYPWPTQFIKGKEIKATVGSPSDYVVNQVVPGPGEDPEIGDEQQVDLAESAVPHGIKTFVTRKPTTTPGA